jgi:hypothetical protein
MSDENQGNSTPEVEQAAPEAVEQEQEVSEEVEGSEAELSAEAATEANKQEQKKQEAAIKKAIKEYELKVNGKSKKISLDLDNEDEVKKYLQKGLAADERMQEASSYKKQAEQLVEMLQKDPLSILRNPALGIDIKKLAEQVLIQDLEEQQLSPEQKKLKEYEEKLKFYEEEKQKKEDENKRMQLEEATRRNYEEVETSMLKALEQADFPAEPFFVRRVADIWAAAVESGWEDAKLEDIMPYVQQKLQGDFKSLIDKNKDPDKLEKLLGKDVLNNYRKSNLSKVKKTPTPMQKMTESTAKPVEAPKSNEPRRVRFEDF